MRLYRLTEPEAFVTLQQAKDHLNVDDSDHDSKIQMLVDAAVQYLDGPRGILGRQLAPAAYRLEMALFPPGPLCLPMAPTISVDAITYLDETGVRVTLDPEEYRVVGLGSTEGATVVLDQVAGVVWPAVQAGQDPDTVTVEFRAGFENLDSPSGPNVPEPIRHAVLLMVGDWYDHRASSVIGTTAAEVPISAKSLIAPWRFYLGRR